MPYKERVKTGVERKKEKVKYKVKNWTEYNRSLRKKRNDKPLLSKGRHQNSLYQ